MQLARVAVELIENDASNFPRIKTPRFYCNVNSLTTAMNDELKGIRRSDDRPELKNAMSDLSVKNDGYACW